MKSIFFLCLISILFTLSCNKFTTKRRIKGKIQFLSNVTGKPIKNLRFMYHYYPYDGIFKKLYKDELIYLKSEYIDGIYYIDHKNKDSYKTIGKLMVKYPYVDNNYNYFIESIDENSERKKLHIFYINPYYEVDFHIKNINCNGDSDTLKYYFAYKTYQFTGCDSIINNYPGRTLTRNIHLSCTLKRNGLTTYFDVDQVLEEEIKNHVYINY